METKNELIYVKNAKEKADYFRNVLSSCSENYIVCCPDSDYCKPVYDKLKENGYAIAEIWMQQKYVHRFSNKFDGLIAVEEVPDDFYISLCNLSEKQAVFFYIGAFHKDIAQEAEEYYDDIISKCISQQKPYANPVTLIADDCSLLSFANLGNAFEKADKLNMRVLYALHDNSDLEMLYDDEDIAKIMQNSQKGA